VSAQAPYSYKGFDLDPSRGLLTCWYEAGGQEFAERVGFDPGGRWDAPGVRAAARLVFLLAGVSYYKTTAAPVIDLGETAVTSTERDFLRSFYLDGLGEFAFRNGLDLSGLEIVGPVSGEPAPAAGPSPGTGGGPGRPLVPFGGGIDSIVTVEMVRDRAAAALFIMGRRGDRFAAIEAPAAVTGLPVVRAAREIDPLLLRSRELGFLNGHVPITGILSAIALMAAVLDGRDAVIMSNEWSASAPTLEANGKPVNHQYSKSAAFEAGFRDVVAAALGGSVDYFSALRPFSELWVARRFAALEPYHPVFRSCNRAFHIDKAKRLDHWCGRCDKCCFIDLILAPFLSPDQLGQVFGGREPLTDPEHPDGSLAERFRTLLGTSAGARPFECVGDIDECRAALLLAARRPDRAGPGLLQTLAAELAGYPAPPDPAVLLAPIGAHFIPESYAPADLLG
jgi:UDP-N-acetyl-alpha-D-muramoyl-L-alanyl-L-glutamate epimerase